MHLKRLFASAGLWGAVTIGIVSGLALAAASEPRPAFSFYGTPIISWRGNGDTIPADAASAGWSGPMFYTTPAEGAGPAGPVGRYPTGSWAPGDTAARVLVIKNVDCCHMLQVDQFQIRLSGDLSLAPKLRLALRNDEDQTLYSGTVADFRENPTLSLSAPILLARGASHNLTFIVSLDRDADNTYQGKTVRADIVMLARQVIQPMNIDVHPSSWPNPINPSARGTIPVAVNGTATLNVRTLDWTTARFGPGEAEPDRSSYEDWNRDGYLDLMLKFDNQESGFRCGMTEATLTIESVSGILYQGSDPIVTPPCR